MTARVRPLDRPRSVSDDLLVAASAERRAFTVLHYDGDYDLIASVTSQVTQWVVPRGSIP